MKKSKIKTLIIGIGNIARQDDGLGWVFLDSIKDFVNEEAELLYRYQLNIEEAELISSYPKIIFVDAEKGNKEKAFDFRVCIPKESYNFSTHFLEPEVILALCKKLYNSNPETYILSISGEKWELEEGLSEFAKKNLQKAIKYFEAELNI